MNKFFDQYYKNIPKVTKIYDKVCIDIETGEVTEESFEEYVGEIAQAGGWEGFIFAIILSLISAYLTYQQMDDVDDTPEIEGPGHKANTRTTEAPLPVVYGTRKVGTNDVYAWTGGYHSKKLKIVSTLSEGECEGIYEEDGVPQIFIDKDIYTKVGNTFDYTFYSGTDSQTFDTDVNDVDPNYTENMRHTCYIVWNFTWDEDIYRGLPERQLILQGKKLYDFRTSTTAWSDNPVVALYDFLTDDIYGIGISSDDLDITSFTAAANYCDTKEFYIDMVMKPTRDEGSWRFVEQILHCFRGMLNYFDGKYYLRYKDLNEESPVVTITDDMIVQDESGRAQIRLMKPSSVDKPTSLTVEFEDKTKNYEKNYIPLGEFGGLGKDYRLNGVTNYAQARILGITHLERLNLNRTIIGSFRDDALLVEPGDIVTLNSTALAISDQLMRVNQTVINPNGTVSLNLRFESYDLYDDDYDESIEDIYNVDLTDPSEVSSIENPSIEEEVYYYRGRTFIRLNISFNVPDDEAWLDHVNVWVSTDEQATWNKQFNVPARSGDTVDFSIDPVEEGQRYFIVLQTVNMWRVTQDFDQATKIDKTILGKSAIPPESLEYLSAVPGDNSLILISDKLNDPDIEVYEFRFGPQWIGGVYMGSYRSPNLTIKGIKPGFFEFTANTLGTNGLYGQIPRYASARVPLPKGYTYFNTYTHDPSTGSFNNTQAVTYNGEKYVKCSHSGGNLTGTFHSKTVDIGASNINSYFIYIDTEIVVTGLGTTWNEIVPIPMTWNELQASTNQWVKIFDIDVAPGVAMEIQYKEYSSDPWGAIQKAEFISAVITTRYIRSKIIITDPSDEVNALVKQPSIVLYK